MPPSDPEHPAPSPDAAGRVTDAARTVTGADIDRMVDRLLFEGAGAARKRSAFWALLGLAAAIASAGIIADSTATVIGP